MNKLLKNILPVLKRACALMGVVIVLVCSLAVPSAAADVGDVGVNPNYFRSVFNLESCVLRFSDGNSCIFNIPSTFFVNDSSVRSNRIEIKLDDSSFYYLNFTFYPRLTNRFGGYIDVKIDTFPSVTQPGKLISNVQFNYTDSFVPLDFFDQHSLFVSDISDPSFDQSRLGFPTLRFDYYDQYDDVIVQLQGAASSISSTYRLIYPTFIYNDDGSVKATEYNTFYASWLPGVDRGFVPLTPDPRGFEQYYNSPDYLVCFSKNVSTVYFDSPVSSFVYSVPVISPGDSQSGDESFYNVNTFMSDYFSFNSGFSGDFTSWIVTAVRGFLYLEIMPGINLSMILLFVFGIGCVFSFLRYFAGG